MLKYPDSKLARMYNEGQKIKNLNFFLDEDPEYFRIVLNFLRKGKVIHFKEENLFVGVRDLAKNLELSELVELLERENDFQDDFSTVVFEFGRPLNSNMMSNEIAIARRFLTRVPESNLAKFFFGEQGSQNPLSKWIFKKGPNRYFISNHKARLTEYVLNFMKMPANSQFITYDYYYGPDPVYNQQVYSIDVLKELKIYGIHEFDHYKKTSSCQDHGISWNENYNVN